MDTNQSRAAKGEAGDQRELQTEQGMVPLATKGRTHRLKAFKFKPKQTA